MGPREHLILLHGGGLGPWSWAAITREMGDDYTVHTPVLPGHEQDGSGKLTSHADAAQAVAQQVGLSGLSGEITVVGFSFGGQVAVALTEAFPERISRLVVVSSLLSPLPGALRMLVTAAATATAPLTSMPKFALAQAQAMGLSPEELPVYLELSSAMKASNLRALMTLNSSFTPSERVLAAARPTTLWFGSADSGFLVRSMESAVTRFPSINRVVWQGDTHSTMLPDARRFVRELRGILSR